MKNIRLKNKLAYHNPGRLKLTTDSILAALDDNVLEPITDSDGNVIDGKFAWALNKDFIIKFSNDTIEYVKYKYSEKYNYDDLRIVFLGILSEYAVSISSLEIGDARKFKALLTNDSYINIIDVVSVHGRKYLVSEKLYPGNESVLFDMHGHTTNSDLCNESIVLLGPTKG